MSYFSDAPKVMPSDLARRRTIATVKPTSAMKASFACHYRLSKAA